MTCDHLSCADCPHRPKSDLSAAPFDRDVAMRSLEYSAVRLGMHWSPYDYQEIEIAAMPDLIDAEEVQHRARLLNEPCASVIAREART